MAKINTSTIVVTASKLVKSDADESILIDDELITQLEAVLTELIGGDALIEIERA